MEDPVAFPEVQTVDLSLRNPLQGSLIAVRQLTCKAIRRVEENVLHFVIILIVHESQNAPESIACECQTCLFLCLPQDAVLRALPPLKLPANADPLVLIDVMFLLDTVDHQVFVIFFNVA